MRMETRARALSLCAAAIAASLACGCASAASSRTRAEPTQTPPSAPVRITSAEAPAATPAVTGTPDVAALVARVSPGVVNITATQEVKIPAGQADLFDFFFGEGQPRGRREGSVARRRGLGSGFLLDSAGHVVTNAHVVENATMVRVTLSDEREFDAKVKGRDDRLDVAVLELVGARDLPSVVLGRSEGLRVGEYVVAIGNPFGLGHTVTMGIVSAKSRALGAGPYDDFVQTDASINPGNSGGPLFNLRGEVVGINTAMAAAGRGIGFAIPVDALKEVLPQLLEKGFVQRGRLGVVIQAIDAVMAKALGLPKPMGALVADVERGSPAVQSGLRARDVVVAVDGVPVAHSHDLPRLVARRAPGTVVMLDVVGQNNVRRSVKVRLDELKDPDAEKERKEAAQRSQAPAARPGVDFVDARGGVVVKRVAPGGTAADTLEPGDVVVEVDGAAPKNAADATARLRGGPAERPALLKVKREGRDLYVALERK
jgi:serine protease Do